jgi:hypothetical protein
VAKKDSYLWGFGSLGFFDGSVPASGGVDFGLELPAGACNMAAPLLWPMGMYAQLIKLLAHFFSLQAIVGFFFCQTRCANIGANKYVAQSS